MADNETAGGAPNAAPKKGKKGLIFALIGVLVLGGGGAAAFFMMKGEGGGAGHGDAENAGAHGEAGAAATNPGLVSLETFLVNLQDAERDRYMKATMRIAIVPETAAAEVKASDVMLARMRDRILTVLMSKTYDEVSNPLGKEGLRAEIQAQVDELLDHGEVHEVMFSEFVVQ